MPGTGFWGWSKPPAGSVLNRSHPFGPAGGLVWLATPGGGSQQEYVAGSYGTLLPAGGWDGATPHGLALKSTNTTTGGASWPWASRLATITLSSTMEIWARLDAAVGASGFAAFWGVPFIDGSWSTPFAALSFGQEGSTDQARYFAGESVAAGFVDATSSTGYLLFDGKLHQYVTTRNLSGTTVTFYRDGVLFGTPYDATSVNHPSSFVNMARPTMLNHSSTSQGEGIQAAIPLIAVWNRLLTAREIGQRYSEPYGMFAPPMWRRAAILQGALPPGLGPVVGMEQLFHLDASLMR